MKTTMLTRLDAGHVGEWLYSAEDSGACEAVYTVGWDHTGRYVVCEDEKGGLHRYHPESKVYTSISDVHKMRKKK